MAPIMPLGYGQSGSLQMGMPNSFQIQNPYMPFQMPQGGFGDPYSASNYANMYQSALQNNAQNNQTAASAYGNFLQSGATRDVGMAGAMASVLNAQANERANALNAQAGYDTAYGQAKYQRANLLDQLMQQFTLGQMSDATNRYGIDQNLAGQLGVADRSLQGQLGVAGINAGANQYNTDANRQVALSNQQNQLALANLANQGNLDVANAQNEAVRAKQQRFSQVLPIFQSLFGFSGSPSATAAPASLASTSAPASQQFASAPAPQAPAMPPPALAPIAQSAPQPPQFSPQAPAGGGFGGGTSLFSAASPVSQTSYGTPAQPPQRDYEPDPYQSSHGLYSVMGKGGMASIPRAPGRAGAATMRPARGPQMQTARTATPQSPTRPPWLIGDIPKIG